MIGEKASDLIKADWGYYYNNYEKVRFFNLYGIKGLSREIFKICPLGLKTRPLHFYSPSCFNTFLLLFYLSLKVLSSKN
jgi:hypothetical protein